MRRGSHRGRDPSAILATLSGDCAGLAEAGRSPFTSAMNTGTPMREKLSAMRLQRDVLPVPVAPAIRPWRLASAGSRWHSMAPCLAIRIGSAIGKAPSFMRTVASLSPSPTDPAGVSNAQSRSFAKGAGRQRQGFVLPLGGLRPAVVAVFSVFLVLGGLRPLAGPVAGGTVVTVFFADVLGGLRPIIWGWAVAGGRFVLRMVCSMMKSAWPRTVLAAPLPRDGDTALRILWPRGAWCGGAAPWWKPTKATCCINTATVGMPTPISSALPRRSCGTGHSKLHPPTCSPPMARAGPSPATVGGLKMKWPDLQIHSVEPFVGDPIGGMRFPR